MTSADRIPLRHLLDSAPDGFIVTDATGTVVWANATAHRLFSYPDAELIGRAVEDLMPERVRESHVGHVGVYRAGPHVRPMGLGLDLRGRRKDGSEFPIEISLSPLQTDEGLLVTAIIRDVSERHLLEGERSLLLLELETERERDRIAMDLHDGIMQDIYAVALKLELALQETSDERYADSGAVERSIGDLHEVVRSIRSFIFDLRPRKFSGTLSEALLKLGQEFEQNAQIDVESHIAVDPGVDFGVAVAVYHIAHEGLSNVQKHARANRVVLTLEFQVGQGRLEIRDNGVGFDTSLEAPEGHHGIKNMRARTRGINAAFSVESRPGEGTALSAVFPLHYA